MSANDEVTVRLGDLSRLLRHQLRHELKMLAERALSVREAIPNDRLSAVGLVADLDGMILQLQHERQRLLGEIGVARDQRAEGAEIGEGLPL